VPESDPGPPLTLMYRYGFPQVWVQVVTEILRDYLWQSVMLKLWLPLLEYTNWFKTMMPI
jgi:hypothetical protein